MPAFVCPAPGCLTVYYAPDGQPRATCPACGAECPPAAAETSSVPALGAVGVEFSCPACGYQFGLTPASAGRTFGCPGCGGPITIPDPAQGE